MRVLSRQEIQHVSGGATTSSAAATNPFSLLLVGLLALFSGSNYFKWFY